MKPNFYLVSAAVAAAIVGCADDQSIVSGTSVEPNTLAELSSSSELSVPNSSETVVQSSSSSSETPVLSSSSENPVLSSSSDVPVQSSSSSDPSWVFSSAYIPPVLCKVGGYGGCVVSYYGDLWSGEETIDTVQTNAFAEDKSQFGTNAGKWFLDANPYDEGGASTIQWAVPVGDDEDSTSLLPVMNECGGLCGKFELNKGTLTYNPFVEVGFYVAGIDSNGVALSADVSNWTGICVMYSSSILGSLVLDLGDSLNQVLKYDVPSVTLSKSLSGASKCFEWRKFKRAGWGAKVEGWEDENAGEMAAQHLAKVVFRFQDKDGTKGEFNIRAIGTALE